MSELLEVQIDDRRIVAALRNLQQAAGDISPALRGIGIRLVSSTQRRFETKTDPEDNSWAGNADSTIANKGRDNPLYDGGDLMGSINYQLPDNNTLVVSSSMNDYAAMMHYGGTKSEFPQLWGDIPARPFLGISDEDETHILNTIRRHLEQSLS